MTDLLATSPEDIDAELRSIVENVSSAKYAAARLVQSMEKIEGWKALGFTTKAAWLESVLPQGVSRSLVYEAKKHLESHPDIPLTDLEKIPKRNLEMIELLPPRKRTDEKVIEMAQGSVANFAAYLNSEHNLAVSVGGKVILFFDDSEEAEEVKRGLDNYMTIDEEATSRSQVVRILLNKANLL